MEAKFPGFLRASEWLTGEKKEAFAFFYALLLEYNKKFNLTAVTEEKDVYYKHFYDSLAGEFLFPQGAACAEIGWLAGLQSHTDKLFQRHVQRVGKILNKRTTAG